MNMERSIRRKTSVIPENTNVLKIFLSHHFKSLKTTFFGKIITFIFLWVYKNVNRF